MKKVVPILLLLFKQAFGGGEVTLSFTQTSGNSDTDTLSLSYQLEEGLKGWELSSKGDYLYKRDNGEETANRLNLDFSAERLVKDGVSFGVYSFVFADPFSGYDFRGGVGPGVSWKFSKELKLSGRFTYTYNNYTDGSAQGYSQLELRGDYKRKITNNLNYNQSLSYQVSLEDKDDYFIHFKANFKVPFSNDLSFNVSYRVDYQNLLPEGAEYHTDRTFLIGVSYSF